MHRHGARPICAVGTYLGVLCPNNMNLPKVGEIFTCQYGFRCIIVYFPFAPYDDDGSCHLH